MQNFRKGESGMTCFETLTVVFVSMTFVITLLQLIIDIIKMFDK